MNPLQSSEVVTLQPGDRVPLTEWVGSPYLVVPGTQHVSVEYANIPDLECGGVTMAPIGGAAQALVRRSDPVIARSNVVDVVVEPAQVNR